MELTEMWRTGAGPSHVQVRDLERVLLDEVAAWLDLVPHQRLEDVAGGIRLGDPHLEQRAGVLVEGGLPELIGTHLAQPLVALDGDPLEIGRASCRERVCQYV